MEKALSGIRVLDLTQFLSGPRCTQLLAEQGAEVIKIEGPAGETMRILMVLSGAERVLSTINRNKKGVVINLQGEEGRSVFKALVARSDVVVENFSPGYMEKLGLDYPRLQSINPGIIYASISGFGQTGPRSGRTAFDLIAQATGGIMHANHMEDRPPGVFFGDLVSGAYCALGILTALLHRERGGPGQLIDISMQDVMYFHNFQAHSRRSLAPVEEEVAGILGKPIDQLMTDRENPLPFWNAYQARDGYVALVALTDTQWNRLMEAIGRADLVGDERFSNFIQRIHNAQAGLEILTAWAAERTVAEIIEAMDKARIPCGPVQDTEALNSDDQLAARGMLAEAEHPRLGVIGVPGTAIKLTGSPGEAPVPCPDLGEHTDEVLRSVLDYSDQEIAQLRKAGAIQ